MPIKQRSEVCAISYRSYLYFLRKGVVQLKPKILVVEDEPLNCKLIQSCLEKSCEVTFAKTGQEAFKLFFWADFDVVLMDLGLPDISGIDVARMIRKHDTSVPILAHSATSRDEVEDACLEAGMDVFLEKDPATIKNLCKVVQDWANKRYEANPSVVL